MIPRKVEPDCVCHKCGKVATGLEASMLDWALLRDGTTLCFPCQIKKSETQPLKVTVEYDDALDRLIFRASDPSFEHVVYLQRGQAWDSAIDSIQEAWRRWRNQ